MLAHDDVAPGQGAAPPYLVNLQGQALKSDGVFLKLSRAMISRSQKLE
jgi:hypothetical protein